MQLRRQGRWAGATPGRTGRAGGAGAGAPPAAQNQREQEARRPGQTLPWQSALGMATVQKLPGVCSGRPGGQEAFCKGPIIFRSCRS